MKEKVSTWYVLVSKLEGDVIHATFVWNILDSAGAVPIIFARYFGFGRALHRDTNTTVASIDCLDSELIRLINVSLFESRSVGLDPFGIGAVRCLHIDWRSARNRSAVVLDIELVIT